MSDDRLTKLSKLERIRSESSICARCALADTRTNVVFGEGDPDAKLMFVGEAPGEQEDNEGRPFIGKAGKLLTQYINRMGFRRNEVYIANVIKCRPPENRKPNRAEVSECLTFLQRQIGIVQPKLLIVMGATALDALFDVESKITQIRGQTLMLGKTPAIITWHPSYVLRTGKDSAKEMWEDCLKAVAALGLETTEDDLLWLPEL